MIKGMERKVERGRRKQRYTGILHLGEYKHYYLKHRMELYNAHSKIMEVFPCLFLSQIKDNYHRNSMHTILMNINYFQLTFKLRSRINYK